MRTRLMMSYEPPHSIAHLKISDPVATDRTGSHQLWCDLCETGLGMAR